MSFVTIREDEQILLFNKHGSAKHICGPRRLYVTPREEVEYLPRFVANQDQYLVVQYRDGRKEHIVGPHELYKNKLELDSADVRNSIKIDGNHMIVVYKQQDNLIQRRIIQGPTIFVPDAHEWIHNFVWHGRDSKRYGSYSPGSKTFTQLRSVPTRLYVNVKDVRANDISVITVKLMIFFELSDVERMLTYTHDPVADFINAVQADVIAFASQRSYEKFIRQTDELNSIKCYTLLMDRAKHIGYHVTKVVYRGYEATPALQATHDNAVSIRMSLKLDAESEEQEQSLKEFRLKREKERIKLKHMMEGNLQEHMQELQRMRIAAVLTKKKLTLESYIRKKAKEIKLAAEIEKQANKQKSDFLEKLRGLGVDTTRYVVALQPEFTADKEVVVCSAIKA